MTRRMGANGRNKTRMNRRGFSLYHLDVGFEGVEGLCLEFQFTLHLTHALGDGVGWLVEVGDG